MFYLNQFYFILNLFNKYTISDSKFSILNIYFLINDKKCFYVEYI